MVLVANQKTKYQMKDDLSLFLNENTDEFVNWLHTSLKQLQVNANQNDDKKTVKSDVEKDNKDKDKDNLTKEEPKILSSNLNKNKLKQHKKVKKMFKSDDITPDVMPVTDDNNIKTNEKNVNDSTKRETNADIIVTNKFKSQSDGLNVEMIDSQPKQEQNDGDVVLLLNPDGGEVDELLQENVNEEKKIVSHETKETETETIGPKVVAIRRQSSIPTSAVKAVINNKRRYVEEDDNEIKNTTTVASVVRVTQRKFIPQELQPNKNLILRAVKEANDSTRHKKRPNEEPDYIPTPIKRRLGEKQVVKEVNDEELDPQDLRNYLNVNKNDSVDTDLDKFENNAKRIVKNVDYEENNPQFVVTLDGVDHRKYMKNNNIDDHIIIEEDIEEEFMENDIKGDDNEVENEEMNEQKVNERCRYWPNCKNGNQCEFQHPTTHCKTFPNCRFGDKCLYIHPNCKFDSMCSRRDCPFTHTTRRKLPAPLPSYIPPVPLQIKQCKYLQNCKNISCPFFHPKNCHFGVNCRTRDCPYIHPNSVVNPNHYKWIAKSHISERQFAISDDKQL
ncbi:zinc finger CCCH domain-containing protein 14-like isoform X2 [Oppia nitens]|nr:zinc finger CCCH domain-containing protein 14-like isoform X2 [Oppia nitens]